MKFTSQDIDTFRLVMTSSAAAVWLLCAIDSYKLHDLKAGALYISVAYFWLHSGISIRLNRNPEGG